MRRVHPPMLAEGLAENARVTAVTADANASHAVLEDGCALGRGEGSFGQRLQGERPGSGLFAPDEADALSPVAPDALPLGVADVEDGARWAAALTADGDVRLWGPNDAGPAGGLDGDLEAKDDASFRRRSWRRSTSRRWSRSRPARTT